MPERVLIVEDEPAISDIVAFNLRRAGYEVLLASDGEGGLRLALEGDPDLVLLDVMLPGLDGIGLCRRVRETSQVPILMMSARGDGLDVVAGLEAGADDYVVKPVDDFVMLARIRSLLRRASYPPAGRHSTDPDPADRAGEPDAAGTVTFGDLAIDTLGMVVTVAGQPVALTPTELRLLLELAAHPGIVLSRHTLLRNVWDSGWNGDSRVVGLCVQRLRKKIGEERIETVRGFGYKLVR